MDILPMFHPQVPFRHRPIEEPTTKKRKLDPIPQHNNVYECEHLEIVFKVCAECGTEIDDDHAARKKAKFEKLVREKKLSLVLDLDHTLLHSTRLEGLTEEEKDLSLKWNDERPRELFRRVVSGETFVTKLRPGVRNFLKEASKLFSLHVFTKGSLVYAVEMLDLIDPGQCYFESGLKIFTRENIRNLKVQKSLDLVAGEPRGILIVDDLERVWGEKDRENLIVIPGYNFFGGSGEDGKSQLAMGTDESETDDQLKLVLEILQRIHEMFFDSETDGEIMKRDVRKLKVDLYNELVQECNHIDDEPAAS